MTLLSTTAGAWDLIDRVRAKLRATFLYLRTGAHFKSAGRAAKIRGTSAISLGRDVSIGDFCWIEAVRKYRDFQYTPRLVLSDRVALSDLVHISCALSISLGEDCLVGSKVYIGDHHHGSVRSVEQIINIPPAARPLGDMEEIRIGARTWIGDGAVLLAGTLLAPDSIVGANSVVRLKLDRPAIVAGAPARVIRYLDKES